MIIPATLNLTDKRAITKGTNYALSLTYKDPNDTPINFTGMSALMKIVKGEKTQLSLSSGSGITLGGALGTILVEMTHVQTSSMILGECFYDFILISGSVKTKLFSGKVEVIQGISV